MKLDTEDYENIYLRIRGRLWKAAIGAVLSGLALLGITSWLALNNQLDKAISAYVASEGFKQAVVASATQRLAAIEQQSVLIQQQLQKQELRAGDIANLPVTATVSSLAVVDRSGQRFYIETGTAAPDDKIIFTKPFSRPPFVALAFKGIQGKKGEPLSSPLLNRYRSEEARPVDLNERGFSIIQKSNPSMSGSVYDWIAVGG